MAFGPTGDATCLRLCARLSIPANARACLHIKPSRRPFRLSALCSNQVEQLPPVDASTRTTLAQAARANCDRLAHNVGILRQSCREGGNRGKKGAHTALRLINSLQT